MTEPIPIENCEDGVIRLHGTRITLDVLVSAFNEGATAEEIAHQYPSIALADVYQAIGYYLRHAAELAPYLEKRRLAAADAQEQNESRWTPDGIRGRLMARRSRVS